MSKIVRQLTARQRLAAGVAMTVLAWAGASAALAQDEVVATGRADAPAPPLDPTAAKLEALEAQIQALQDQVSDLKASTAANIQVLRTDQQATTVSLASGPAASWS
jgi:cell division protein FtsB